MIRVFVLLLPVSLALRKDRKKWIKKEYGPEYTLKAQKNARKLMNTLVSLGPAYIKLGQWLSARADILPQPYMAELAKLQDEVPPAPYEQIDKIIRHDLGQSYEKFEHIDSDAVSGASLVILQALPCMVVEVYQLVPKAIDPVLCTPDPRIRVYSLIYGHFFVP